MARREQKTSARPRTLADPARRDRPTQAIATRRRTLRSPRAVETSEADDEFLQLARDRFKQAEDADKQQRQRELDDLAFYAGDQWATEIINARKGMSLTLGGTSVDVPARPTITINKVKESVKHVLNSIRQADLGFSLAPADDFGELGVEIDPTEIELREGLVRRIQRASESEDASFWGAMRAAIAGRGYWGVGVRYVAGKNWNKEIYIERFYNQASVSLDPFHQEPDGSDAEWGMIGTDMPWDQYTAEFPWLITKDGDKKANPIKDADDAEFRALGDEAPGWFTLDKNTRSARVVMYYYTERTMRELLQLADGTSMWGDEAPESGVDILTKRMVPEKKIKWAKIDGKQKLDEGDWEGPDIPIIKVMGEELQPYDQERRAQGMIRQGRGAQIAFNGMISKFVETVAYSPIPPWQYDPESIENFEDFYALATVKPLPGLPYHHWSADGSKEFPMPTRTPVDTGIASISQGVAIFDMAIKSTMGTGDPELGNVVPSLKSGKALNLLTEQSQLGKSDYLDNLKRSKRREGEIVNNLLYPIYGKAPGRIVRIVSGVGDEEQAITIAGPPNAGAGQPLLGPSLAGGNGQAAPKQYRLTKDAKFNVIVKVTRNSSSLRDEENQMLGTLIDATKGAAMGVIGDLWLRTSDGPGHDEMADRYQLMLDPKIQAMIAAKKSGQPLPPYAIAQMAQMKGQLDHAHQLLDMAQKEIATKQTEQQGKLSITQEQEQHADMRAALDRETKIAVAEIQAQAKQAQEALAIFYEERARIGAHIHEAATGSADAEHALTLAREAAKHDAILSAQDHIQTLEQDKQKHEQTIEQQQQAADLAPDPTSQTGDGNTGA